MTVSGFLENGSESTIVEVQERAGKPWLRLSDNAMLGQPAGGGSTIESRWGRGADGLPQYQGSRTTGNPARYAFDVSVKPYIAELLDNLLLNLDPRPGCGCDPKTLNVRTRIGCGDKRDKSNYDVQWMYSDAGNTGQGFSSALANIDQTNDDVMVTGSMSAGVQYVVKPLTHSDIKGTFIDTALNAVIFRCKEEWYAVSDADATPGYQSIAAPLLIWSTDDFASTAKFFSSYINVFLSGNATDVTIMGGMIFVASPTNGVAYAAIKDLKNGVSNPWTLATGFTSPNFPRKLFVIGSTMWAVANGGYIYRSTDGGYTWSAIQTGGLTAQNLQSVYFDTENYGWAAGAAGSLLRYFNGNWSLVTTSLSTTINDVVTPPGRANELYLATANGNIYFSENAQNTTPTFTAKGFPGQGVGQIYKLVFGGFLGQFLFVLQSDAADNTRVLRDPSGGSLGGDVEIISDYGSPENNGINDIALATPNVAITVGETIGGYGYIGKISG